MNLRLLDLKKKIIKKAGSVTDLLDTTFVVDYSSPNFIVDRVIMVSEETVMRPDLISVMAYGSDDYTDIILKVNEISNPFTIDVGDLLIIPKLEYAQNFYRSPSKKDDSLVETTKDKFIDPNRKSKKDENRIEKLLKLAKTRKNGSKEIKTTNQLKTGEKPFSTDSGALKLGR